MLTPDEYLWHWADRLGLQGELQYVLQAAAGGSSRLADLGAGFSRAAYASGTGRAR